MAESSNKNDKPGFLVTQGRIALLLSLVSVFVLFYQVAKFALDSQYRIQALEEKWITLNATQQNLTSEIGRLSTSINDLNVILRGVEVRQQTRRENQESVQ